MGTLTDFGGLLHAVQSPLTTANLAEMLLVLVTSYLALCLYLTIYRLFFSPLAIFPGPTLAAISDWYDIYYDIFANGGQGGQSARHIEALHRQYGPIVRITPHELHVNDPEFFSELYGPSTRSKPIDKSVKFKYRFGIPNAAFSTTAAEQHQEPRAALNPFFFKQRILKLQCPR